MKKKKYSINNDDKKKWVSMRLKYIDKIKNIILGGGGKLSLVGGDPGENRKPMGGGT